MSRLLSVFNPAGMLFAAALLAPYIFFFKRYPGEGERCPNKAMLLLCRIARIGSLLLMAFHFGILEQGFTNPKETMERFWWIATAAMLVLYWALWALFFRRERKGLLRAAVITAAVILIFSGILQVSTLLFTFGFVYLIAELYLIHTAFQQLTERK